MSVIPGISGASGVHQILALRQQIIDRSQLLQQVRSPETGGDGTNPADSANGPGGSFTSALKTAVDKVNQVDARADAATTGYETGQVTDIAQVMLARQEAGVAFEATMQVRNKLLSAYQDIMKLGV